VVLAARLSLSFPLLISALPLWAIDYEPERGQRTFHRCWFSDGGLSSNFPIHLFDGLLPMWPTFGIQLEDKLPDRDNMVFLPTHYNQGYGDRWDRFDEKTNAGERFGGFLSALAATMQNWNDNTLTRMPGVRDRVVRVRLLPTEGGLNLDMKDEVIKEVSQRGADAAGELVKRFVPTPPDVAARGFDDQRWVRMDVLCRMLEKRLPGVEAALGLTAHATPYATMVANATTASPFGHKTPLSAGEANELGAILAELRALAASNATHSATYSVRPVPEPELRVRPPH
jgi:hypothetical protein